MIRTIPHHPSMLDRAKAAIHRFRMIGLNVSFDPDQTWAVAEKRGLIAARADIDEQVSDPWAGQAMALSQAVEKAKVIAVVEKSAAGFTVYFTMRHVLLGFQPFSPDRATLTYMKLVEAYPAYASGKEIESFYAGMVIRLGPNELTLEHALLVKAPVNTIWLQWVQVGGDPRERMAFEQRLQPGMTVTARWTSSGSFYQVVSTIKTVNGKSFTVTLNKGLDGYPQGHSINCPRLGNSKFSDSNSVWPEIPPEA